jgi:aminopeptidase YwaD
LSGPKLEPAALLKHVKVLSEQYPHRHCGESDEIGAVAYIAGTMREYGLSVDVIEVPVMGWQISGPPLLELLGQDPREIECSPFIFSGSTAAEGLEGELRYVGQSLIAGGFEWEKFAIVDVSGQWRGFVVGRPEGPAITQAGPPAGLAGAADVPLYTWPSCVIGAEDLADIVARQARGETVRVRYRCRSVFKPDAKSYTVRGELRGAEFPDQVVILGSHHDAQGAIGFPAAIDSPGANDNASAIGIFLEMARHYVQTGSSKTLWFTVFGGEERNLIMSREFARRLVDTGELARVVAYIGIDQAANGEILRLLSSGDEPQLWPPIDMRAILSKVADELGVHKRFTTWGPGPLHAASDHWPFYYAGIPSFLTGWHPFPTYHRSGDNLAYCNDDDKYLATANLTIGMLEAVLRIKPHEQRKRGPSAGHITGTAALTSSGGAT